MLKQKLTARVDKMVENGFVEEVAMLHKKYPSAKALDAPGYRAFSDYLRGEIDLNQAKAAFATRDYQLAKRQMTWFKRDERIVWCKSTAEASMHIKKFLS
jgi:tRNA dimethylallyltransferase